MSYIERLVETTQEMTDSGLFRNNLMSWKETSRSRFSHRSTLRWDSHRKTRVDAVHGSQEVWSSREDSAMPSNTLGRKNQFKTLALFSGRIPLACGIAAGTLAFRASDLPSAIWAKMLMLGPKVEDLGQP